MVLSTFVSSLESKEFIATVSYGCLLVHNFNKRQMRTKDRGCCPFVWYLLVRNGSNNSLSSEDCVYLYVVFVSSQSQMTH